jgi:hypothetical protein
MSTHDLWSSDVLRERWDDTARTYTAWDASGTQVEQRAYTVEENEAADARAASEALRVNEQSISTKLAADMAAMQAILDQSNAELNAGPAQELKDLARTARRLIRKVERLLDGSD